MSVLESFLAHTWKFDSPIALFFARALIEPWQSLSAAKWNLKAFLKLHPLPRVYERILTMTDKNQIVKNSTNSAKIY